MDRPLKYVITERGCIECTSHAKNKNGYSYLKVAGKRVLAHRYLYEQAHGKLPHDAKLRHTCGSRSCMNIEHLKVGTITDNFKDIKGGRPKNGKKRRI